MPGTVGEALRALRDRGSSRSAAAKALGVNWRGFVALCEEYGVDGWPSSALARRSSLSSAHAQRGRNAQYSVQGITGTRRELALHFGVPWSCVDRRLRGPAPWPLELAVTVPKGAPRPVEPPAAVPSVVRGVSHAFPIGEGDAWSDDLAAAGLDYLQLQLDAEACS